MRFPLVVAAGLLLVASLVSPAPGQQQEVELKRVSNMDTRLALMAAARPLTLSASRTSFPGLPGGDQLVSRIENQPVQLALVGDGLYARSKATERFAKVALLEAGDGRNPAVYGPLAIAAADGGQAEVEFLVLPGRGAHRLVRMMPAGFLQGTVELDGRRITIGVADASLNGRFGEVISLPMASRIVTSDLLGVDFDGNGKFSARALRPGAAPELQPLCQLLSVGDGWYKLSFAADGSKAMVEKVEPEMGQLKPADVRAALTVVSPNGMHQLIAGAGQGWSLPAGKYQPLTVTLAARDDAGRAWTTTGMVSPGDAAVVDVVAGQETALPVGDVLTLRVNASLAANRTLNMSYEVSDDFGTSYGNGVFRDGERLPAPKFTLVDASGKVLKADSFSYG